MNDKTTERNLRRVATTARQQDRAFNAWVKHARRDHLDALPDYGACPTCVQLLADAGLDATYRHI